jgi:hypothetical protein
LIADLWDAFERWPSIFTFVPDRAATAIQEHEESIEALSTEDIDRVPTDC